MSTHQQSFKSVLIAAVLLGGLWAISPTALADGGSTRPNILWIIADDLSPDLGAWGTPAVSTPNLDGLTADGVRFTRAYATSPVCSASRSALITGMYQTSIGAHHHRTQTKQPLPAPVQPITAYFQAAGYFCTNGNANQNSNGKTDYNFQGGFNSIYQGNDWRDAPPGTPFFAQVQIYDPHRSFKGLNADPNRPDKLELPAYYPDHPLARADYADYLAAVERLDNKVGNVLSRLQSDGHADNTIVFFFGDHGRPHIRDKQFLYEGGILVPLIVRDPTGLLGGDPNSIDMRMVSLIDVAATSLALAGIEVPSHMHGLNFCDPNFAGREEIIAARDRTDGTVDRIRSIRVGDYKLLWNFHPGTPYMTGDQESSYKHKSYPMHTLMKVMGRCGLLTKQQAHFMTDARPTLELYNLADDPNEVVNLASDPAHAAVRGDLQARLRQWTRATGDLGDESDPDAASNFNSTLQNIINTLTNRVGVNASPYEYLGWWSNQYGVSLGFPTGLRPTSIRLPNGWFAYPPLGNGAWSVGVPMGWGTGSGVVQNLTAAQLAPRAKRGENLLMLNSQGGFTGWKVEDFCGMAVTFEAAKWWVFKLDTWLTRRSDSQGVDAGILRVALEDQSQTEAVATLLDFDGNVAQGVWSPWSFELTITPEIAEQYGNQQVILTLQNVRYGTANNKNGRVLLDDLAFSARLLGDQDGDFEINASDLDLFASCMNGPNTWLDSSCENADPDDDNDADMADVLIMQCAAYE